jgi:hypothetical protein
MVPMTIGAPAGPAADMAEDDWVALELDWDALELDWLPLELLLQAVITVMIGSSAASAAKPALERVII